MASLSGGSGTTQASLVQRIVRRLDDHGYEDIHTNAPTASGTSLTVASNAQTRFQNGGWLDWVGDGTLDGAIITDRPNTTTLTVRRDYRGAVGQSHSANAVFRYMPRFYAPTVGEIVTDVIANLYPDIYSISEQTLSIANPVENWYNLAADTEEILAVYVKPVDQTLDNISAIRNWDGVRFLDSTFVTNKKGLQLSGVPLAAATSDNVVHVIYKAKSALADLNVQQQELVILDSCIQLLTTAYASESKPERRSGLEGAPDSGTAIRFFAAQADTIRKKEQNRLRDYLPERSRRRYHAAWHAPDSVGW